MHKVYILNIFFIFSGTILMGQGWEKVYSGIYPGDCCGTGNQTWKITSDGGNILIGATSNPFLYNQQINIIKTNSVGLVEWIKVFHDSISIRGEAILETNDGFLISGTQFKRNSPISLLFKISKKGNLIWTKSYNDASDIRSILKVNDGIILLGYFDWRKGVFISKIDSDGNVIWASTLNLSRANPTGIIETEDKGFMVVANSEEGVWGNENDCYLLKFDYAGNLLWTNSYGYTSNFSVNRIRRTSDGNYLLAGRILMKVDKNGKLLDLKQWYFGGEIKDIILTSDNGYAVVSGNSATNGGIVFSKLNSNYEVKWKGIYGNSQDLPINIFETKDKGFLLLGNRHEQYLAPDPYGLYLIKTDSLGQSGCNSRSGDLPFYSLPTSLCVINSLKISASNESEISYPTLSSFVSSVNVVDPCCFAKASIINESYYPCRGDSAFRYSGYGAPGLKWYNGATTNSIITTDTVVFLTVTNTCGNFTDTLIIHPAFAPSFSFSVDKNFICAGDSVLLQMTTDAMDFNCSGSYVKYIGNKSFILKPKKTTIYDLFVTTSDRGPGCYSRKTFTLNVSPEQPVITIKNDSLISSSVNNNQWYLNGDIIPGAMSPTLITVKTGTYLVEVSENDCTNRSEGVLYKSNTDTIVYERNAWQKIISSNQKGFATCIQQTEDGGFILGVNYYSKLTDYDIVIIKTNREGKVEWSKTYGGQAKEYINDIIRVKNGYIGVGYTTSFGTGNTDAYVLSFNLNGNLLWSKTYGDWNNQLANSVQQTKDNGFIITGSSTNPHNVVIDKDGWLIKNEDLYLLKLNANGDMIWSKIYDINQSENGSEVYETNEGNFIIAGSSQDYEYNQSVYLIKTDPAGKLLWSKAISSKLYALNTSMKITVNNDIFICSGAYNKANIIKLNENGTVQWSKIVNVAWGRSLTLTSDNGILFTCGLFSGSGSGLTKIDLEGKLIWSSVYNINGYNTAVKQITDGSFILTGQGISMISQGDEQISIINTDRNGLTDCSQSFTPEIVDEPYTYFKHTTQVSELGQSSVASTKTYSTYFNTTTTCRSAKKEINEVQNELMLKIYPIPTDGMINMEVTGVISNAKITIYDITGRQIYFQSLNGRGIQQINMNTKSRGVYFLELSGDGVKETRKILLR